MDLALLNEYSARVARSIFAAYPGWEAHATAEEGVLIVRVPCPVDGRPELAIYTDDDEITVSYDRWHGHFDDWAEQTEEHLFDDAYAFAHAFLSERISVAVHMSGSDWAGSQLIDAGEEPPEPGPGQTVYVHSWLGTHDSVTDDA